MSDQKILDELKNKFGEAAISPQDTHDNIPTYWAPADKIPEILSHLKNDINQPFKMLYDLTAIDERARKHRDGQPDSDFTVVYHLLSFDRNADVRIKAALKGDYPSLPSSTGIWKNAGWYEREVYDMFGISFEGHPHLRRILMPPTWQGHPLRKEHPARATEMGPFQLPESKVDTEQEALLFKPEDWGMQRESEDTDFMFLNIGPQHPGTHGVLRVVLQLDGEEIVDAVPDIGYHHRGAEKMAERQSWHTYIPYTDRVDYLGGVLNNLPYVMAVEQLAGIKVPQRAQVIRVMMSEFFRIIFRKE
jgi:NADH-quinone oxidoreductase subunit C/D